MEQPREQYSDEQEYAYEVRAGFDTDGSNIPPEVHRTAQEMKGEYGIEPSLEAILHFHPELLEDENRDALDELYEIFDTHNKNATKEKEDAVRGVVDRLVESGIVDLSEGELIGVISQHLGLSTEEARQYLNNYFPFHRRYGDHL